MGFEARLDRIAWFLSTAAGAVFLGGLYLAGSRGTGVAGMMILLAVLLGSQALRLRRMAARIRRESDAPV